MNSPQYERDQFYRNANFDRSFNMRNQAVSGPGSVGPGAAYGFGHQPQPQANQFRPVGGGVQTIDIGLLIVFIAKLVEYFRKNKPQPSPQDPSQRPGAWHPDPTSRHEFRYWNGNDWTEHVSDGGIGTTDRI